MRPIWLGWMGRQGVLSRPGRPLAQPCDHRGMPDYRVAAFSSRLGREVGTAPEGKQHAYLEDARATVCGFGLSGMRLFSRLRFSTTPSDAKCMMCERIIRAASR